MNDQPAHTFPPLAEAPAPTPAKPRVSVWTKVAVILAALAFVLSIVAVARSAEAGPRGPQGQQGIAGSQGAPGPAGPQGPRGPRGLSGTSAVGAPASGGGGGGSVSQSVTACKQTYGSLGFSQAQLDTYCQPGGAWNPAG